jgi:D-arabinose 1-dehydrogenase-like Zn-dependent alcohol dehydrogenase
MAVTSYRGELEMLDLAAPQARPGWAVIQVITCGLCFSDVKTARGRMPYSAGLLLPHVAGHEVCGRVVEVAPGDPLKVGERVVAYHVWSCHRCSACRRGEEQICLAPTAWMGFTHTGGFQESLAVPVEFLLPIPDSIPDHLAPALTCAMGTAYRATIVKAAVKAGDRVAVLGLGGVGIHAALIAQAAGARVIGVEAGAEKAAAARKAGIAMAVAMTEAPATVSELTGGEGVDAVIETTGVPGLLEAARRLIRPGGRIAVVGYHVGDSMAVSSDQLVLLEESVLGSRYCTRSEMEAVIRLVADQRVTPVVEDVLPLAQLNEAIARLESGGVTGRLIIQVASD